MTTRTAAAENRDEQTKEESVLWLFAVRKSGPEASFYPGKCRWPRFPHLKEPNMPVEVILILIVILVLLKPKEITMQL